MIIFTMGLPNGVNPTQQYQFNVVQKVISIPGNYVGRDQVGEPTFPEQANWLNSLKPAMAIEEVWYGTWECADQETEDKFIQLLQPFVFKTASF